MVKRISIAFFGFLIGVVLQVRAQDEVQSRSFNPLHKDLPEELIDQQGQEFKEQTSDNDEIASDNAYILPYASPDNLLKLTVANSTGSKLRDIVMEVKGVPEWLKIESNKRWEALPNGEELEVTFPIHVDEKAPVNEPVEVVLTVKTATGYAWNKTVRLKIESPSSFELEQNFPNPFNSSTTISYVLPETMHVRVAIYNMLGQRIATVVDEEQQPGSLQVRWNASRYASGLYFYRIIGEGTNGEQIIENKKMLLIK